MQNSEVYSILKIFCRQCFHGGKGGGVAQLVEHPLATNAVSRSRFESWSCLLGTLGKERKRSKGMWRNQTSLSTKMTKWSTLVVWWNKGFRCPQKDALLKRGNIKKMFSCWFLHQKFYPKLWVSQNIGQNKITTIIFWNKNIWWGANVTGLPLLSPWTTLVQD